MRTIHRDIVGGFILSSDDKILLGTTGVYAGMRVVPGGGVDEGETKAEALRREMLEETGLDISLASITPIPEVLSGESEKILRDTGEKVLVKMNFYNYIIKFSQRADQIPFKAADDFIDAEWYSKDELPGLKLSPPTAQSLKILGLHKYNY